MPRIYRYEIHVPQEALDENGHVNNVEYVRWMQEAAIRHSKAQGGTAAAKAIGATWVARSHRIEYLKPAFAGDHIVVLTWVADFRKVRSLRKYKFVRSGDDTVLAEGETDWVFLDAETGRPRAIAREVAQCFEIVGPDDEP